MKTTMQQKQYPDFVAYHFVNAYGELVAMEEDGAKTSTFLEKGGLNVDGSSIRGGVSAVEKSDLRVVPEKDSFLTIRLDDETTDDFFEHHRFMAHLETSLGEPHQRDPRNVLRRQVERAHSMGFEPYMFSEVEFYVVDKESGEPVDTAGYCSLPPDDKCYAFRHKLGVICKQLGVHVKRIHHECGPAQNEMELDFTPCMKNADDTLLCMWIMRLLADRSNQEIIFSPKPFVDKAGNGLHHHILLRDVHTGENIFANKDLDSYNNNADKLSEICRQGIAGLLKYADDITAVFVATQESFDRLKPGFEAPVFKCWDFSNRTALVRVPEAGSLEATRFEYRGGDLSGSVHLLGAVLLAAVLAGIEEGLTLVPNTDTNIEKLSDEERKERGIGAVPLTIFDCITVLKTSHFLQGALGPEMVQFLIQRDEELLQK